MGLVRDWRRQAARAVGASLLAPVALLLAAAAVATGGGLGGLGALGQIASGPGLPETGLVASADGSLNEADTIVGADLFEPPTAAAPGSAAAPGGTGELAAGPGGAGAAAPLSEGPAVDVTPLPPSVGPSPTSPPGGGGGGGGSPGTGAPPPRDPVRDLIDTTRGIGESLPGPVGPTTGDILDLLVPPAGP